MSGTLLSSLLRALFSLIAVIGLIYLFMHILLKLSPGKRDSLGKNSVLEIVGRLALSPKKMIYLIRIGKKILVVGVNGGIYLLTIIEDEETIKSFQVRSENLGSGKFSKVLKNFLLGEAKINGLLFSNKK